MKDASHHGGILGPSSLLFAVPPLRVKGKAPRASGSLCYPKLAGRPWKDSWDFSHCFLVPRKKNAGGQKWAESLKPRTRKLSLWATVGQGGCKAGNCRAR